MWIVFAMVLGVVVVLVVQSIRHHDALIAWRTSLEEEGSATPWPAWNGSWPVLPRPRNAVAGDLRGAYAFAAANPDRLRFIPCYCGCARIGHQGVLSCFVSGFTSQGKPIWTDHAFTCPECVNIVREVSLMTSRGMSLGEIRASIEEHHGGLFRTSTSTPLPK